MPGGAPWGLWLLRSLPQDWGSVGGSVDLEDPGGGEAGRDRQSQSGRGCVAAIQGGYFGDQQPG